MHLKCACAHENLTTKCTSDEDCMNSGHYVKTYCISNCAFNAREKCFRCLCVSEWRQWSHGASLGLFPTETLCQIEQLSADRPRSSLDHVCVREAHSVTVRSCMCAMCVLIWVNACMYDGVCTFVDYTSIVRVCVFESPWLAIHLDSVCSHITSLSCYSLTRTTDGRSPEGGRE